MKLARLLFSLVGLALTVPAHGAEVESLASCTTKVLSEISRQQRWSGKPPAGCFAEIAVEKRPGGLMVTAWGVEPGPDGWASTSFSALARFDELSDKKRLATANANIMSRARRLERCLKSYQADKDPGECRIKGSSDLLVGETSGAEYYQTLRLEDQGRECLVEYRTGNSSATPTPPPEFDEPDGLPPGMELKLRLN